MLERSSLDDVMATRAFTGLPANFLKPSIVQVGLDPAALDETVSVQEARNRFGGGSEGAVIQGPSRATDFNRPEPVAQLAASRE